MDEWILNSELKAKKKKEEEDRNNKVTNHYYHIAPSLAYFS